MEKDEVKSKYTLFEKEAKKLYPTGYTPELLIHLDNGEKISTAFQECCFDFQAEIIQPLDYKDAPKIPFSIIRNIAIIGSVLFVPAELLPQFFQEQQARSDNRI